MVTLIYWQEEAQKNLGNQSLVHQAPRKTP